ncbi:MAG: hypothetical protein WCO30_00335 [bacterium]
MSITKLYFTLDEAREEIKKRWGNVELRKKIEADLGVLFMPDFLNAPRSISFRQLISPDNGFMYFYNASKYIGVKPLVMEYEKDIYVSVNVEKKALGKLRVTYDDKRAYLNIMDFHSQEKKPLEEVTILTGEKLSDFHHGLMQEFGFTDIYKDFSNWFTEIGRASEYYYPLLVHCVTHGMFFDLLDGDEHEKSFTETVVLPAVRKIEEKYGLTPIIIKAYPDNQTAEEDFYWFSYPPFVNNKICQNFKEGRFEGKLNFVNEL